MAPDKPTSLITVTLPSGATLEDALRQLGIGRDAVDTDYPSAQNLDTYSTRPPRENLATAGQPRVCP
jgi:putative ubiquitin-RnfH superfamily antitoxin RatB of RatAB toxin-antitoxin module